MFDMFVEELDHLLDYARRATDDPRRLAETLRNERLRRLTNRFGDSLRWPTGPATTRAVSPTQTSLLRKLSHRAELLGSHPFLDWLRTDRQVSPTQKLQRFVPLWAIDILGYRDFNECVLRYREPRSAAERAINRWTVDLASHGMLYLNDWLTLGLDRLLG